MPQNPAAARHAPPSIQVPTKPQNIEEDFDRIIFASGSESARIQHPVFIKGDLARPPVLILHELTGLSWQCARLARLVQESGFRVYVPLFFGSPNTGGSGAIGTANLVRHCLNQEFKFLQANVERPITTWLLELARRARGECNSRSVGVIGMCLTGAFGLTLLLDSEMMAVPVVCQPSIPLPGRGRDTGLLERDLPRMAACAAARKLPIRALRFAKDAKCPQERMDRLEQTFGTLLRWDLDGDQHSTLTSELASNTEAAAALEDMLEYLKAEVIP